MYLILRAISAFFNLIPQKIAYSLGVALGKVLELSLIKRKKICLINLDIAFKNQFSKEYKEKIISDMYKNLGKNIVGFFRIPKITKDNFRNYVEIENEEILIRAKKQGKGIIVITAHFGFWDILPLYFAFYGYGANFITKYVKNKSVNKFWMEYRSYGGVNPIYKKNSSRQIINLLKKGESVGFVIDQNMNERNGVFVDFFGVKACTTDAPAKLAIKYGSPVIPIFCIRKGNEKFLMKVEKPLTVRKFQDLEESVKYLTRECTKVLEKYIIQYPDHWIWMHKRWKTRPLKEKKIY